jgi:putative spermidine/putrescine transport system substrate-binding protein
MLTRREFTIAALAAGGCAFIGSAKAQSYAGQTLRFATYGGTWQGWIADSVEPIFRARTGATIQYVPGVPVQHLSTMVAARGQQPPFDVVSLTDDVAYEAASQGLIQTKVDAKLIPNLSKLPSAWRENQFHGPADFASLAGILYDADKFQAEGIPIPTDWDSLSQPKLAGRIAIPDITFTYKQFYAAINLLKKGDETNFDGSIEWVKSLKNPIIFSDFPTLQTRFNSGEIWALVGLSGYINRWPGRNIKLVLPPVANKRGILVLSTIAPTHGTPKAELAQLWIDSFISDEAQTSLVTKFGYAPVNMDVARTAAQDPRLKPLVLSDLDQINALYDPDWGKVNAVYPEWIDKWNRAVRN